jgi:hypothetical protein
MTSVLCRACGATISSRKAQGPIAQAAAPGQLPSCASCDLSPVVAKVQGWLSPANSVSSARLVNAYLSIQANGRPLFRGSLFDAPAAAATPPNAIGPLDLQAVRALSMHFCRPFVAWVLSAPGAATVTGWLSGIPNTPLKTLTDVQFETTLGPTSAATSAWRGFQQKLTSFNNPRGTNVAASKLLAAKRRKMLAPEDRFVRQILGIPERCTWKAQHVLLRDPTVSGALVALRTTLPNATPVQLPRMLDILVWMKEWARRRPGWTPPPMPGGWGPPPLSPGGTSLPGPVPQAPGPAKPR